MSQMLLRALYYILMYFHQYFILKLLLIMVIIFINAMELNKILIQNLNLKIFLKIKVENLIQVDYRLLFQVNLGFSWCFQSNLLVLDFVFIGLLLQLL